MCDISGIFLELMDALEEHQSDLKLSFGLEYSSIVDWVADLTPRKGHPQARQYGEVWQTQSADPKKAIRGVLDQLKEYLESQDVKRKSESSDEASFRTAEDSTRKTPARE